MQKESNHFDMPAKMASLETPPEFSTGQMTQAPTQERLDQPASEPANMAKALRDFGTSTEDHDEILRQETITLPQESAEPTTPNRPILKKLIAGVAIAATITGLGFAGHDDMKSAQDASKNVPTQSR